MMSNDKIGNYQSFFSDQKEEAEREHTSILSAPVSQLVRRGEILVGYIDSVNSKSHVVLRFHKNTGPRLKMLKSITVITKTAKAELGENVSDWSCEFQVLGKNIKYTTQLSDILPLYYTKRNDNTDYDYVGCTNVDIEAFDFFKRSIAAGKQLTAILFTPFPPTEYYTNLISFLERFHDLPELMIEPKIDYSNWHPEEIAYSPSNETLISDTITKALDKERCCILQGPPGSGKSYNIAQIIAQYLNDDKTVCVTTMANKGLLELVQQPPLAKFLAEERISKTNLTSDECSSVKGLKPAPKNFLIPKGELLCSTNYVLSRTYNVDNMAKNGLPLYDLVIIEEASQAFLATIIAFKKLGRKCLIVGDPMQLPPIITNPNKSIYKVWNANTMIEGLKSFALGTDVKSYRLTTTFRLTEASAKLTASFYNNHFTSVQHEAIDFSLCQSKYFPPEGGVLYCQTDDLIDGIASDSGLTIISDVIGSISRHYPERSLAIITPFKDTAKVLQKSFVTDSRSIENLTIETIDRIQGMTVDYAILYIPGRNPAFALEERRFNVATSRSRTTTLIISDYPIENMHIPATVRTFISHCKRL